MEKHEEWKGYYGRFEFTPKQAPPSKNLVPRWYKSPLAPAFLK